MSALVGIGSAHAHIVHFTNPAPGNPAHYPWEVPIWGQDLVYLDITVGPGEQLNVENGNSIGQGIAHGFGWAAFIGGAAVAVNAPDELFLQSFMDGDSLAGHDYSTWSGFTGEPGKPEFPEGERRYIGVQTATGNYGWIEVERAGLSFTAYAWAYETEPGVVILAGQVPTPGAAAVLTLGVLGATVRRSRS